MAGDVMALVVMAQEADRKRAYVADDPTIHTLQPSPKKVEYTIPSIKLVTPDARRYCRYHPGHQPPYRRRSSADKASRGLSRATTTSSSMQIPPSPRVFAAPMSSFMAVFDDEATRRELEDLSSHDASHIHKPFPINNSPSTSQASFDHHMNAHFSPFHKQRESISPSPSESSDNSPTTTVSTLDSSSTAEPSPAASPETPASSMPLTYTMDEVRFQPPVRSKTEPAIGHFFEMQQRPTTPARKARNLKNLAVNTTTAYNLGRATLSAPFPAQEAQPAARTSAPSSPVFVKPPTPPRRKLGSIGLTIKTPANNTEMARIGVPPTPTITKPNALRHFQSSPSLPLMTPSHAPVGGMTLPSLRIKPSPRGFAEVPFEAEEDEPEPNFDIPQSQEEKPESYPSGPIRIYESGVDLYYEPNVEVASRYDVILNVASEVKNPFLVAGEPLRSPPIAEPTSNIGVLVEDAELNGSPDTPRATQITTQISATGIPSKQPEYIHIPWEHNTDLVPDLYRLVKVIDERVQQGKRVLVHCQCGVSRSATLIVAYGIYKNPGITVQEAYDAVKKRSKWIGPNMNLIMQLQEFRTGLMRNRGRENQLFSVPRKLSTTLSSASTASSFDVGSNSASGQITPRTAPLPPENDNVTTNRARSTSVTQLVAAPTEDRESLLWPPPSERRSWREGQITEDLNLHRISIISDTPYIDTKGQVVPMVTVMQRADQQISSEAESEASTKPDFVVSAASSRSKSQKRKTPNFSRVLPLRGDDDDGDSAMTDAPPVPCLLSPRNEEFHMLDLSDAPAGRQEDSFGLFSPLASQFPKEDTEYPAVASTFFVEATAKPLAPPPLGNALAGFSFFDNQQPLQPEPFHNSVMSPTKASFPRDFPLRSTEGLSRFESPARLTPRKSTPKSIKTKFSSPSLHDTIRLQRMQDELAHKLPGVAEPRRHMDDLDALMSPRAAEFTTNPFHDLLTVQHVDQSRSQSEPPLDTPVTPTSSNVDPRSPPQIGISPITRNIFGVL